LFVVKRKETMASSGEYRKAMKGRTLGWEKKPKNYNLPEKRGKLVMRRRGENKRQQPIGVRFPEPMERRK